MLEKSSDNDPANVQVHIYIKCISAPVNIRTILSKYSPVTWMYLVERSGHSVKELLGEDGGLPAAGGVDDHHAALQVLMEAAAEDAHVVLILTSSPANCVGLCVAHVLYSMQFFLISRYQCDLCGFINEKL